MSINAKKIWRQHPEATLTALAIIFLAIIIAYFSWGIGDLTTEINRAANTAPSVPGAAGFDLKGAQSLNLKGLVKPQ